MTIPQQIALNNFFRDFPADIDYKTCLEYLNNDQKAQEFVKHPLYEGEPYWSLIFCVERLYDILTERNLDE